MPLTVCETITKIANFAVSNGHVIGTAESCTAGLLATMLTDNAGASAWYHGGVIAYHNTIKTTVLSVPKNIINTDGAVSENTAMAMCKGVIGLHHSINTAVAITGIAGPEGGTVEKPVGTVCFAFIINNTVQKAMTQHFTGDRHAIRQTAASFAITQLCQTLEKQYA